MAREATLRIAYLCTSFPVRSETFIQREVIALRAKGVELLLYSLHKGGRSFHQIPIMGLHKASLLKLLWRLPVEWYRNPSVHKIWLVRILRERPPSWLSFWENMYGFGIALLLVGEFRRKPPDGIHGVWGSLPAMAAAFLSALTGIPYSFGAHAYDLYEFGGDWLLAHKIAGATFVQTSTQMAAARLGEFGCPPIKIVLVRRGLLQLPPMYPRRRNVTRLCILSVGRFVAKKGLRRQLELVQYLDRCGLAVELRMVGDGPLRSELLALSRQLNLEQTVSFPGWASEDALETHYAWADMFWHTGQHTPTGDRDGLPNVIPEAMARGIPVASTGCGATNEAIVHGQTGFICRLEAPETWESAVRAVLAGGVDLEQICQRARSWVENHFDTHRETEHLVQAWNRYPKARSLGNSP